MSPYARYDSLAGKVVFITGGASGIGADIVRAFRYNDSRVAFVDIQQAAGKAIAEETDALFVHCDITDTQALRAAIELTREELGPIGVLVNNAANDTRTPIDEMTPEDWDRSLDINLKPQFFAAQAVRPQMRELGGGSIINFSSIWWRAGGDPATHYVTAKAGVHGLTRALARGFGDDNIRVNVVEPGAVPTERQIRLWYGPQGAERIKDIVSRQILKSPLSGVEIAQVVLFLASDQSTLITRQTIAVDAGMG
jgi:NAD(P)-dependent dehydrogenase (short-subunit alcohol dehydrogenase family)